MESLGWKRKIDAIYAEKCVSGLHNRVHVIWADYEKYKAIRDFITLYMICYAYKSYPNKFDYDKMCS